MHRFLVSSPLPAAGRYSLTGDAAHRIGRVLRMTPGERVRLFDGSGREVEGTIEALRGGEVTVGVTAELPPGPPAPALHLYQALIRPNRLEWLLEKATELGAALIQPVITERCQVRPAGMAATRTARWRRILVEAAEQCGRRTLPALCEAAPLATALAGADGLAVLPWEAARGASPRLGDTLRAVRSGAVTCPPVSLFIGPEGGFTEAEAAMARERGALIVSLGPHVLRAETAAVAALAIAADTLGGGPVDPRVF